MKKSIKRLSSIVSMAAIISTTFGANMVSAQTTLSPYNENSRLEAAGTAAESDGMYATNPNNGVGKEATIKIDGDFSDWSEDMLIAQGAAGDTATRFKGCHENWVMDTYSVYGAWDDENVYIGWQNVNIYDTFWEQDGNGPLSDNGKPGDAPIFIALDTGKGNPMNGKVVDKGSEVNIWGMDVGYTTRVDAVVGIKSNLSGVPSIFKADSTGASDYTNTDLCKTIKEAGIEVAKVDDCFPSKIMGVWNPGDDNELASYDTASDWIDYKTKTADMVRAHDTKYDTFYEMKIPYSALGITKADLEQNGLGVMQIIGRGESGMDCVPHDPSMLDNVHGDYAADPSSSHEKDDHDDITVPLASLGKLRQPGTGTGTVDPPVSKDPKITKFEADKENVKAGDEIKFTCTASNATSYEFTIDGKAVDESEVSKNVLTHAFDEAGTYEVEVTAKGASGTKDATEKLEVKVSEVTDNPPIENPEFEITKFTIAPKDTCKVGEEVKLSARADGEDDYAYKFTVVDEDDNETVIKDYSSKEIATWTPEEEGTYTLRVYAKVDGAEDKDAKTKEVKDFKVTAKSEEEDKLTMDSFTADVKEGEIETGKEVNFKAEASGSDDITYVYTVSKDGGDEEEIESEDGEATWTPEEEGKYTIKVTASADGLDDVTESKTYTVKDKQSEDEKEFTANIATKSSLEETIGNKVKFTASSENGQGDVTYKFIVNDEESKYSNKDFSSKLSYTFEPEEAGEYEVYVIAKDEETGEEKVSNKIKITFKDNSGTEEKISTEIDLSNKTLTVGDTLTITPSTKNAKGSVTYQLLIDGEETGKVVVDDKLSWTAEKAGKYKVSVKATDEEGNEAVSDEISVTVKEKESKPDTPGENPGDKPGEDSPTADNTPVKALGILGILGSAIAVLSRKKQNN